MMESVGFKTASLSVNIICSWRSSTGSDDGIFLSKPAYNVCHTYEVLLNAHSMLYVMRAMYNNEVPPQNLCSEIHKSWQCSTFRVDVERRKKMRKTWINNDEDHMW